MTNIDQTIPRKIITALIVSDDFAQGYFNIQKDNLLFDEIGLRIGSNTALSWQSMGLDIENPIAGTYTFHDTQTPLSFEFKISSIIRIDSFNSNCYLYDK